MNLLRCAAAALAGAALAVTPLAAQGGGAPRTTGVPGITVDTTGVGALIDQGMNKSQVMKSLQYLTDVIGPRLTGSPAARAANDWTMKQFQAYGLDAHLEQWNFGGTWERGPMWMRMTAPRAHDVVAASWAWAPGTGGKPASGPVVRIDASTPESLAANKGKVKGAWVMLRAASLVWNNDGPPMTAADSQRQRDFFRGFQQGAPRDSAARARQQQFNADQPFLLRDAGALGILLDAGKEQDLLNMSGSPTRVLPLPQVVVAHEEYAMFERLLGLGITPQLQASIANAINMKDSVPQWNTVAEIRGTEHPGQVVIVGAHLDSWDLGTGATDNGTGSAATLEAARIIAQSGIKPKRTIRFILFTGEEEGLIGSRKYAEQHAGDADSIQAVIVLDNGAGAITGQALQGRPELFGLWRAILAPVHDFNADEVTDGFKGGTDHLSFLPYGVPGFNFNQITRGYNHTHHSQSDTWDKAIDWDLRQASTVMAVSALELANLTGMIPRGQRTTPPVVAATKVSPELLKANR
ncbi:MAG TPA: M20/M25/M40 family metallo-hydrolase [Gemmatimonadales bacterium]|nr:M20/M25/M40 family metallo-hydrolase [Gemmatimonadales bacterium]